MAQIVIRVELRGNPTYQDYEKLHTFMEQKKWYRAINGTAGRGMLPHSMYQGASDAEPRKIASALRSEIQAEVWTIVIVLVINTLSWGMNPT
jgi:hypothetical protein